MASAGAVTYLLWYPSTDSLLFCSCASVSVTSTRGREGPVPLRFTVRLTLLPAAAFPAGKDGSAFPSMVERKGSQDERDNLWGGRGRELVTSQKTGSTVLIAFLWQTFQISKNHVSAAGILRSSAQGRTIKFLTARPIQKFHAKTVTKIQKVLTNRFYARNVSVVVCRI